MILYFTVIISACCMFSSCREQGEEIPSTVFTLTFIIARLQVMGKLKLKHLCLKAVQTLVQVKACLQSESESQQLREKAGTPQELPMMGIISNVSLLSN